MLSLSQIPVSSWFDDPNDTELRDLIPFFEALDKVDNVLTVLGQSPMPNTSMDDDEDLTQWRATEILLNLYCQSWKCISLKTTLKIIYYYIDIEYMAYFIKRTIGNNFCDMIVDVLHLLLQA